MTIVTLVCQTGAITEGLINTREAKRPAEKSTPYLKPARSNLWKSANHKPRAIGLIEGDSESDAAMRSASYLNTNLRNSILTASQIQTRSKRPFLFMISMRSLPVSFMTRIGMSGSTVLAFRSVLQTMKRSAKCLPNLIIGCYTALMLKA